METLESTIILGNSLYAWLIASAIIVGSLVIARIVYFIFKKIFSKWASKTETKLDDNVVDAIEEPISIAVVLIGFRIAYSHLEFDTGGEFISNMFGVAVVLLFTWLTSRVVNTIINHVFMKLTNTQNGSIVNDMEPILKKTLSYGIWAIGFIMAISNAGYDVGALIAGLGIGGIAMAMAAKDFVANIFGGITIFIDSPFRVGDRVKVSGIDGTVIEIGIRTTRINTLEGRTVTIPNNQFTNTVVENVTAEPSRKVRISLGLTYDTTPENIQLALDTLKKIVDGHIHTEEDVTVWFDAFGDFSLNVNCNYYINKQGHWANTPSEINLSILTEFNALKLDFAFPTSTIIVDK